MTTTNPNKETTMDPTTHPVYAALSDSARQTIARTATADWKYEYLQENIAIVERFVRRHEQWMSVCDAALAARGTDAEPAAEAAYNRALRTHRRPSEAAKHRAYSAASQILKIAADLLPTLSMPCPGDVATLKETARRARLIAAPGA